ncbi:MULTISPECIES: ferredoxin [Streptomyces]|uniref:Ferredoxin n=1 Tax=Streptomyces koelreuteriae TaxID=2838015 RepID=A0ABX8FPB6_9ACTN|nr:MULTISPECIES: ferredoxin [Streptomyces]QWB23003.1 ferredoxin [Streptomyces koelreuteriae]UUA05953.1 ferredoxin [Streptomyces koelreuteriae]UUA13581.1 ferredoxin [Streptomyces sp. CRCS-T-1]
MSDRHEPLRIEVDRDRCAGAGMCALTAPEVFDQDDEEGLVVLLRPDPPPEHRPTARMAAGLCPAGAITVGENGDAERAGP